MEQMISRLTRYVDESINKIGGLMRLMEASDSEIIALKQKQFRLYRQYIISNDSNLYAQHMELNLIYQEKFNQLTDLTSSCCINISFAFSYITEIINIAIVEERSRYESIAMRYAEKLILYIRRSPVRLPLSSLAISIAQVEAKLLLPENRLKYTLLRRRIDEIKSLIS